MKRLLLLFTTLLAFAWAQASTASVSLCVEHDVDQHGMRGMRGVVNFTVEADNADHYAKIRLVFYDANGNTIPAINSSYSYDGKNIGVEKTWWLPYKKTTISGVPFFMPYSAFAKQPRGEYYIKVWVYVNDDFTWNGDSKARSENVWFTYLGGTTQPKEGASASCKVFEYAIRDIAKYNGLLKEAYRTGAPKAQKEVALCCAENGIIASVIEWSEKAARQGYEPEIEELISFYAFGKKDESGKTLVKTYRAEAVRWLEKLQKIRTSGYKGYWETSYCYALGDNSLPKDKAKALAYAELSAEKDGNNRMTRMLAELYCEGCFEDGYGDFDADFYYSTVLGLDEREADWMTAMKGFVAQDETKAFSYLKKAADMGDERVLLDVGTCYLTGMGTERNPALAEQYFTKAGTWGLSILADAYAFGAEPQKDPAVGRYLLPEDTEEFSSYGLTKNLAKAQTLLDQAIAGFKSENPKNIAILYDQKGMFCLMQGDEYEALRWLGKTLKADYAYYDSHPTILYRALFNKVTK